MIGERRREVIEREVAPLIRAGRGRRVLWLVRGELRRRRLRSFALERCGGAAFDLPFATIDGHVAERYRALPARRRVAGAVERGVLLARLAPGALRPGSGQALRPGSGQAWPGTVERLGRLIRELGRAGVFDARTFEARLRAAGRGGPAGGGAREAAEALERYGALLEAEGLHDPERALAAVAAGPPPEVDLLVLDGLGRAAPVERDLLRRLAGAAGRTVVLDDPEGPWPLRSGGRLRAVRAGTRAAEVEAIAARIARKLEGGAAPGRGAEPSQVAVVLAQVEAYAPLVREIFPRLGIPFALLEGEPLAGAGCVRALLDLAEAVVSGFDRAAVARALLAPSVGFRSAADGRALDYGRLDRAAREAGIAGPIGREGWRARLADPVLDEAFAALASFEGPAPPVEMRRRLLRVLDRFEVTERLFGSGRTAEVAREAAAVRALADVLADVARGLGAAPVPLAGYLAALRGALAGATFRADGRDDRGRVLILGRREIGGLEADHVFFAGLSAQAFPGARSPDIFLGEEERRALGLEGAREHVEEARAAFGAALAAGRRTVTLSYATEGEDDRAARSPLVTELGERLEDGLEWAAAPVARARTMAPEAVGARAVAVARARLEASAPGPHEGAIGPVPPPARISPSDLETYAACPFRAFAARHLGLAPLPEVEDEVTERVAGERIHRILKRFYDGFARGSGEEWLARASARMLAIAREVLAPERGDAFWRARAAALLAGLDGREGPPGVLRAFVEREARAEGFAPVAAEERISLEVEHAGGRSVVSGIVDRVDVTADGGGYVVYDYKSGRRTPDVRDVIDGLGFQLPVYLVAAAGLAGGGARPLGAAYYPLSDPAQVRPRWFGERGSVPADVRQRAGLIADLDAALARVPPAIGAALDAMGRGLFHPGALPPERKGCRHCDFRRICRVDDARMRAVLQSGAPGLFRPLPLLPEPRRAAPA